MLVVRLLGGLGNQMYQFAFAKALENKLNKKVLFDNSWYRLIGNGGGIDLIPLVYSI